MRALRPVSRYAQLARLILASVLAGGVTVGVGACDGTQATQTTGHRPLPLVLHTTVQAAPGAIVEAIVSYTAGSGVVELARDSVTTNTGGPAASLSLSVNVTACVSGSANDSCVLQLTLRLKRDGAVLDEATQQLTVGPSTMQLTAAPVELLEVASVSVTGPTAALANFEPGDAVQLTATARDRNQALVAGRTPTWSVVSGGVSISASGLLQATTAGAAVVRAAVATRSQTFNVTVKTASVDTITMAPLDTTIYVGGAFDYRVTAKSPYGVTLTNRNISVVSSSTNVATVTPVVVGQTYRAQGITPGLVNITATSTEGRGGATVTRVTTLRVLALQGRFSGLVTNANTGAPLVGVTVSVRRVPDNTLASSVVTQANGTWTSDILVAGTYSLTFTGTGFNSASVADVVLPGGPSTPTTTVATVQLVPTGGGQGIISGLVRDATNNAAVATATVEIRAGANNTTGTVIAIATTNASGMYTMVPQTAGTYTLRATRSGYVPSNVNVTVTGTSVVAPTIFMSPSSGTVAWRFVLQWGALPTDLDAHLTGPIPQSQTRFHVYFGNVGSATASPFATLDIDQISGFGPETITISQEFTGTYRYFVENFSEDALLRSSNASVSVYRGSQFVTTFAVPQQEGTVWQVFEITNGTLVPINTIGSTFPPITTLGGPYNAVRAASDEWASLAPWNWSKTGATTRKR